MSDWDDRELAKRMRAEARRDAAEHARKGGRKGSYHSQAQSDTAISGELIVAGEEGRTRYGEGDIHPRVARSGRRITPPKRMSWLTRALLWVGAGVFLVLGIIGLIIPILPGVLFLAIAVYLLARSSSWVRRRLDDSPKVAPLMHQWERSENMPLAARARLLGLIGVRSLVEVFGGLARGVSSWTKRSV